MHRAADSKMRPQACTQLYVRLIVANPKKRKKKKRNSPAQPRATSASSPLSIYAHRCIGSCNPTRHSVPNSARLTYLSVYDARDCASKSTPSPYPPSSLTHAHSIQSHTLLTPTLLTFMCTQDLWCLARFARSRGSGVTMDPDIRLTILSTRVHSQVLSLLLTSFLSLGVPVQRTT